MTSIVAVLFIVGIRCSDVSHLNNQTNGHKQLELISPRSGRKQIFFYGKYFENPFRQSGEHTTLPITRDQHTIPSLPSDAIITNYNAVEKGIDDAMSIIKSDRLNAPNLIHHRKQKLQSNVVWSFQKRSRRQMVDGEHHLYLCLSTAAALRKLVGVLDIARDQWGSVALQDDFTQWFIDTMNAMGKLDPYLIDQIMTSIKMIHADSPWVRTQCHKIRMFIAQASSVADIQDNEQLVSFIKSFVESARSGFIFGFWEKAMVHLFSQGINHAVNRIHFAQKHCNQLEFQIDFVFDGFHHKLNNLLALQNTTMSDASFLREKLQGWMRGYYTILESMEFKRVMKHCHFLIDLNMAMKVIDGVADWLLKKHKAKNPRLIVVMTSATATTQGLRNLIEEMVISKASVK